MSLHLLQARTTYSSPSTPFLVIYLIFNYAHRFSKFHGHTKTNYIYTLSITHLKNDVKKNLIRQTSAILGVKGRSETLFAPTPPKILNLL